MPRTKSLDEHINDIGSQAGASMQPEPPPQKEEEVIPDIREAIPDRGDRLKLLRYVTALAGFKQQEKEAKKAAKPLIVSVKGIMGKWEVGKCLADGIKLNYYNAPRSSINKDKLTAALLAKGLLPADVSTIIAAATTVKDSYTLKVTPVGEEDGDDE